MGNTYKITGDVANLEGWVYLKLVETGEIDSARVENGRFVLEGSLEQPVFAQFYSKGNFSVLIIPDSREIFVKGSVDKIKVTESPAEKGAGATPKTDFGRESICRYKIAGSGRNRAVVVRLHKCRKIRIAGFLGILVRTVYSRGSRSEKIYEEFHDRGFEVFGVSVDTDKAKWQTAIEKYKMDWIHVSSLKEWDCPAAKSYGINPVPTMYLIDPDGIIIKKDISNSESAEILGSVLK